MKMIQWDGSLEEIEDWQVAARRDPGGAQEDLQRCGCGITPTPARGVLPPSPTRQPLQL